MAQLDRMTEGEKYLLSLTLPDIWLDAMGNATCTG